MKFTESPLKGCFVIDPEIRSDQRGWFGRTFCVNEFSAIGLNSEWKQINYSHTSFAGTVRGLHFQHNPYQEVKLIHCVKGSVQDVILDLRKGSETFLSYYTILLSAQNHRMIYIPKGMAHGFQSLEDESELIYHHSEFYQPSAEGGINIGDPRIALTWPLEIRNLSERDKNFGMLCSEFKGI
ncbi:MAG TPA: dTDP-4-dehydrorhamnose 3,5-epimerase family protein [Saprospiraceae bacterium]|nr:dTDP-4-dehydrorhamnose 3,5-epimerase family protein [Saprospiraceae bacterium]